MVALRSARLEALFGAPLDELKAADIRSLVDNGVSEEFDIDFKESLYGRGDSDKRALSGDVAALANTAGGVIVIGVAEDAQARATAAERVELSDAEKARMLQVIAAGVSPMPMFDVISVPLEGAEDAGLHEPTEQTVAGFYVLAVPRSQSAPHAVLVNEGLRYPKRNGATTRYLSEPEVAAAYRDRLAGLGAQVARIEQIEQEATNRLARGQTPWVMVSLVPDLPGSLDITHSAQQKFQNQTFGKAAYDILRGGGVTFSRTSVGRHRLIADGTYTGTPEATGVSAEYHGDGSGVYSLDLWDMRQRQIQAGESNIQLVDDEAIVLSVLTGLRRLADHSRDRAGAGGNALVRVNLVRSILYGLEVGHGRRGDGRSRSQVAMNEQIGAAETVASLDDLANPGPALVAVAARLADEIGQVFGIPEMGQLTRDGEVRIRYWGSQAQPHLRAWAEQHDVPISERGLEDGPGTR